MFFLKCFDFKRFVFGVTLFGYGVFTFAAGSPEATQTVTIPYRAFVLVINFVLFFHGLRNSGGLQNVSDDSDKQKSYQINATKTILTMVKFFLFFYSLRLMHSVYLSDNILSFSDKSQYIFYWFFMCLIPGINFSFLDTKLSYRYMYVAWTMLLLIGIPSLFLNVNSASNQFSSSGRVSTATINPIALGHYATSLFLLSIYR
jgi:hypothetical protein